MVTSYTRTRSQDGGGRARPRAGEGTYVTGKVLLAAEEGVVPRELGLEEALDLLREDGVGLKAHDTGSHDPISSIRSSTWMKARPLTA